MEISTEFKSTQYLLMSSLKEKTQNPSLLFRYWIFSLIYL